MAIFILIAKGKTALATTFKERDDVYFGLGGFTGPALWTDTPPPVDVEADGLMNLLALKKLTTSNYIIEDSNGNISILGKTYKATLTPTNLLHLKCVFVANEAIGLQVSQFGIYIKSQFDPSVPAGQTFFLASDITDPGIPIFIANKRFETVQPDRQIIVETVMRF